MFDSILAKSTYPWLAHREPKMKIGCAGHQFNNLADILQTEIQNRSVWEERVTFVLWTLCEVSSIGGAPGSFGA
jgi:hypothetical protein